ncbi:hypothetical protein [Massilia phyllosphaerae]|uniref:hypothetical protein n=1 Tax=Massilia phyllosphaerae TaxID=3106034 RepID=UPI002B1CC8AD|nr:hypothetical protein [Massilia sp. SGZ-792]
MAEKMTLTAYLAQRGVKAKALTRGEATLLGIAYPLQKGWARKHGAMMIEDGMRAKLVAHAEAARQAAEEKASASRAKSRIPAAAGVQLQLVSAPARIPTSPVPGFVPRLARRYRKSKSAPWA